MKWTSDADELLVALWADGLSMRFIARGMVEAGYDGVNRNMIAGRKEKLVRRGVEFEAREDPFGKARERNVSPKVEQTTTPETTAVTHDDGVEYLALGPDGCKAILDKIGSYALPYCCGKLRVNGSSYCADHLRKFTNPQFQTAARRMGNGKGSEGGR